MGLHRRELLSYYPRAALIYFMSDTLWLSVCVINWDKKEVTTILYSVRQYSTGGPRYKREIGTKKYARI
jgi:hypothetical protein